MLNQVATVLETFFQGIFSLYTKNTQFAWDLAAGMSMFYILIAVFGLTWSLYRYFFSVKPASNVINKALGADKKNITKMRLSFSKNFDRIDAVLSKPGLGRGAMSLAWLEFKESLFDTKMGAPNGNVLARQNSIRPSVFFSNSIHPPKFLGFVANLFVGVGLLLTFIGIVAVLKQAGIDLAAANGKPEGSTTNQAIERLIFAASTKFITSIFGVGFSILLKMEERILTNWQVSGVERICSNIERGLEFVSPQSLADQTLFEAKEQTKQLKNMGETLAAEIGEKMNAAVTPLAKTMQALKESVEQGARDQNKTFREAAGSAVSDATGAELKALAQSLSGLSNVMHGLEHKLQASGAVAAEQIAGAAQEMRASLSGLPDALAMASISSAENFEQVNIEAQRQMKSILVDAAVKFSENNSEASADLSKMISDLHIGLAHIPEQMSEISVVHARLLEEAGQNSGAALTTLLKRAGDEFASANKETSDSMVLAQQRFAQTVESVASLGLVIEAWREGASSATVQMREILEASQANQVATAELTRSLDQRSREAAQNLSNIAGGMKSSADASANALDQAKELHATITQSHQAMTNAWDSHRSRFESVDADLANAAKALNDAADQFAEKISQQINAMDTGLSRNISGLKGATEELTETIEEIRAEREGNSDHPQ